mgnify:CR=1 FL=1
MCGIGGVLGSLHENELKSIGNDMIKKLAHRGPDGNGKMIQKGRHMILPRYVK